MNTTNPSASALLTSVLTATQNGVLVYQAIRTDGIITDLQLSILNAVAERDLGKPAIEIVGQLFSRLFPTPLKADLFERYRQVLETGEPTRFEYQYKLSAQHNTDWFDISVVRLMADSLLISYDNITQGKSDAEAARLGSVLQQAFDASVNGITVYEAVRDNGSGPITDFRFVMINEAGLRMSGYTREQLLGRTLWEIYPATGINGLFSRYVAVCETGQPFAGEHHYPEYDIWREVSLVPVPNGVMVTYNDITTRRKTEEAARQQTQFVENLMESVPAGMAVMKAIRNRDGRLMDFQLVGVNSVLQEILCLSPAQVRGQALTVAFSGANASGLLSRSMASVELGEKQAFEMPFGSQEKRGWYRVSMAPQGDQVILAVTDMSDTRRAQLAQHQEAELLQSVLNASQDSIVAVDAVFNETGVVNDFVYVMMNPAGEKIINRRLEDIRGKGMLEVFPANRETGLFDVYRQVWETGQPQRTETRYDADGVTGWSMLSIVRRGPGLLITVTDTTGLHQAKVEQQAAQQQLQESEQRFQEIAENVDEVFWIHSADPFRLLYVNAAFERVWKITFQRLHEEPFSLMETVLPEDRPAVLDFIDQYRAGKEGELYYRLQIKGEPLRWLLIRTFIIHDETGRVLRHIGIASDVTSQKEKEFVLQQSLLREQELNQLKSQLVSTASHEFRTPLTTIQSSVELIKLYLNTPAASSQASIQKHLEVIVKQIGQVSSLLTDVLTIGRIEAGKITYNPLPEDLIALCENLIETHFSERPDGRNVQLLIDGTPRRVELDAKLMGHVLTNLLTNAFKFSLTSSPILRLIFRPNDLLLQVIDLGIGVPASEQASLFQAFFRASNTNGIQGTGLGLVIARQFVECHGGRLDVESQEKKGTTFTITLPMLSMNNPVPPLARQVLN